MTVFGVIKVSTQISKAIANKPYFLACLAFNEVKQEYAEKVMNGKFSMEDYKKVFIDKDIDYYINLVESAKK